MTIPLTFHKGVDYAVVMKPNQTTDNPLAMLFGIDRDVTKYGNLFAAGPGMLAALKLQLDPSSSAAEKFNAIQNAIAQAEGRS